MVAIDNENFHSIVGREKDLIITAGGENIAPQPIHDLVKEQLPVISQVLLLGDKQKFVSCFLTLAVEVDTETMEPTGKLSSAARDWVEAQGSNATTVQEVIMMYFVVTETDFVTEILIIFGFSTLLNVSVVRCLRAQMLQ